MWCTMSRIFTANFCYLQKKAAYPHFLTGEEGGRRINVWMPIKHQTPGLTAHGGRIRACPAHIHTHLWKALWDPTLGLSSRILEQMDSTLDLFFLKAHFSSQDISPITPTQTRQQTWSGFRSLRRAHSEATLPSEPVAWAEALRSPPQ